MLMAASPSRLRSTRAALAAPLPGLRRFVESIEWNRSGLEKVPMGRPSNPWFVGLDPLSAVGMLAQCRCRRDGRSVPSPESLYYV